MANVLLPGMLYFLRAEAPPSDYLLNAPFTGANQGFADGQVLNTVPEGITDGQLTIVEKDGTLAIVSNKCAFTVQATPTWADLGFYSQAISRALGRAALTTVNFSTTGNGHALLLMQIAGLNTPGWSSNVEYATSYDGTQINAVALTIGVNGIAGNPSVSTDYNLAIVLGGYDSNGVPWCDGETPSDYLYGASFFIQGGEFGAVWHLLWRTRLGNTSTLYAAFSNYNFAGTIDDFRVPVADLSDVMLPTCFSSFDAANGTSLDAITPEVGGSWTEQAGNWDIQGNKANPPGAAAHHIATVSAGIADFLGRVTMTAGGDTGAIVGRFTDTTHYWMVRADQNSNELQIYEVNGGFTKRASTSVAITGSVDYDLVGIFDGQTIVAFLDGANRISYSSASLNEFVTVHGLYSYGATQPTFDNFHVNARISSVYDDEFDVV